MIILWQIDLDVSKKVRRAKVIFSYAADSADELNLQPGQVLKLPVCVYVYSGSSDKEHSLRTGRIECSTPCTNSRFMVDKMNGPNVSFIWRFHCNACVGVYGSVDI